MNEAEQRAYKRGYAAGYNTGGRKWPSHRPPAPPDQVMAQVIDALQNLRDVLDGCLATFDEDDVLRKELDPLVDLATAALAGVGDWLKEKRE